MSSPLYFASSYKCFVIFTNDSFVFQETEVTDLNRKMAALGLELTKKLHSLETHPPMETEFQIRLTPDQDFFEIIDSVKSREESETKSERSNGDWTKVGDGCKKEGVDLKSKNDSNNELDSVDDKMENQSLCFESISELIIDMGPTKKKSQHFEDEESESNYEPLKLSENFNETISDALDNELSSDNEKGEEQQAERESIQDEDSVGPINIINKIREIPEGFKKEMLKHCDMNIPRGKSDMFSEWLDETPLQELTLDHLIKILSSSLPKIIPNIILNKREVSYFYFYLLQDRKRNCK